MVKRISVQFLLILLIASNYCYSQIKSSKINDRRMERGICLSVAGGGPIMFGGISVDAFITPRINVNLNVLPVPYLLFGGGGGIKYHLKKTINNWSPYVGLELGWLQWYFWAETNQYFNIYFPLGVHYIGKNGFNFSFEVGILESKILDNEYSNSFRIPMGEIKFGYRFQKK